MFPTDLFRIKISSTYTIMIRKLDSHCPSCCPKLIWLGKAGRLKLERI